MSLSDNEISEAENPEAENSENDSSDGESLEADNLETESPEVTHSDSENAHTDSSEVESQETETENADANSPEIEKTAPDILKTKSNETQRPEAKIEANESTESESEHADTEDGGFKAIDAASLESVSGESVETSPEKRDPDYRRFSLLFGKKEMGQRPEDIFKALYELKKKTQEDVFKHLFKPKNPLPVPEVDLEEEKPLTPEEEAFEKRLEMGFQQGFDEGKEQGTEKGHAQGFEKGEKEGLEKGEKQGFEKGEKEGFEQGFQKGETEAEAKTREKGLEILRSLEETLKTSDTALDEMITKYEEDIISLVCKITEKVVMAKLETDNEIVRHTVMDALKSLANPEEIVLSISSEDYEYIEMIKDEFFEVIDSLKGVSVNTDPSVQRGGCRIETSTASITADPQEKLKAVFDTLTSPGEDIE